MKYGKYLEQNVNSEWKGYYVAYEALKKLVKQTALSLASETAFPGASPRTTSLTVARAHDDALHQEFFTLLNAEVTKVGKFTEQLVKDIQNGIDKIKDVLDSADQLPDDVVNQLGDEAMKLGQKFLAVEKYVNLNYMGFHKILKKHDKKLPHVPCYQFYLSHLHHQPWTQGGYSDLLVKLSDVHSRLRKDTTGKKDEGAAQGFIRSTQKFWVRSQDISTVKHHILQNLPVFRFDKQHFAGDAQLISSVYFDNDLLELYHGRLDKKPGAIALRVRWYGSGDPDHVFVERKTHKEGWKGEVSVKERFSLTSDQIIPFLDGKLKVQDAAMGLRQQGKSESDIEKFTKLFSEVQQQVDSKQLGCFIRTSYMRTAFQIPYDAAVRISLDTNLQMLRENPVDGPSCAEVNRWYRDPLLPVANNEITHFPHGVLEIKLSLREGQVVPQWVEDLLDSGYLTEVHKFSKFIHGTATLFPDRVQAVPYWVDDESIRQSMILSAAVSSQTQITEVVPEPSARQRHSKPVDELRHPLLEKEPSLSLIESAANAASKRRMRAPMGGPSENIIARLFPFHGLKKHERKSAVMRLEPKVFFANERTFMSWMEMAVTLGSVSTILLGISNSSEDSGIQTVEIMSLILLPLGIIVAIYATFVFWWRASKIEQKKAQFIHDEVGTVALGGLMMICMFAIFVVALIDYITDAID